MNAITVEHLSVSYGDADALEDVSLSVEEGEYLGILGPNGGGKTTLISAILGLIRPDAGTVTLYGGEAKKMRSVIGYVPQLPRVNRKFPITAREAVLSARLKNGPHPFFRFTDADRALAEQAMESCGVSHLADRTIDALSGGEFQRLLIARALATEPRLLLLDEPVSSADPASRKAVYGLLDRLSAEKALTVVMVTHDFESLSGSMDRAICLSRRIIYDGKSDPDAVRRAFDGGDERA